MIFSAVRPVILNGIGEVVTRPDLLDRSMLLTLPTIGEGRRRDERELRRAFDTVRPRVLGALLDAVSTALANRDTVRLSRAPRQADFARWVTAGEAGLNWPAGAFMHAYQENRSDAHELALEASSIAGPLRSLWAEAPNWRGRRVSCSTLWLAGRTRVSAAVETGRQALEPSPARFGGSLPTCEPLA